MAVPIMSVVTLLKVKSVLEHKPCRRWKAWMIYKWLYFFEQNLAFCWNFSLCKHRQANKLLKFCAFPFTNYIWKLIDYQRSSVVKRPVQVVQNSHFCWLIWKMRSYWPVRCMESGDWLLFSFQCPQALAPVSQRNLSFCSGEFVIIKA